MHFDNIELGVTLLVASTYKLSSAHLCDLTQHQYFPNPTCHLYVSSLWLGNFFILGFKSRKREVHTGVGWFPNFFSVKTLKVFSPVLRINLANW